MSSQSLRQTQAFFTLRAAGWEERYAADAPQFERAVREMALPRRATVLDLGCGTARAMPYLCQAVGDRGRVIGLDATLAMLREGQRLGRRNLLVGDVAYLPFPADCADAIFAGGLLPHLADPEVCLREMARVTRPGGMLAVFHPIGRVALAARHGGVPSDDDVIAPARLHALLEQTGWRVIGIDDALERYLALARCAG